MVATVEAAEYLILQQGLLGTNEDITSTPLPVRQRTYGHIHTDGALVPATAFTHTQRRPCTWLQLIGLVRCDREREPTVSPNRNSSTLALPMVVSRSTLPPTDETLHLTVDSHILHGVQRVHE